MALLFTEGFDTKTTPSTDMTRYPLGYNVRSGNTASISTTGGRFGGRCMAWDAWTSVNYLQFNLGATLNKAVADTVINFGFWFKTPGCGASQQFFRLGDDQGSTGMYLILTTGGSIAAKNWNFGSTLATGSAYIPDNGWHWIEVSFKVSTTAGWVKVYVDGVQDINFSGVTASSITSGAKYATWYLGGNMSGDIGVTLGANGSQLIDDVVIWDDQGSAFNTFPIGAQRIYTQLPTSDASVAYTRDSGANNYARVNEITVNTDVSYVDATATGNADYYGCAALSGWTPGTINAVMVKTDSYDPSGGGHTARHNVKVSGTAVNGSSFAIPYSYRFQGTPFYTRPAGGAWTSAEVGSSLQFGMEVVT